MSALLPVALDLARLKVAVIGDGPRAARRLRLLRESGASDISVLDGATDGRALRGFNLVFIADLDSEPAHAIATRARAAGALVNVEDAPDDCDFQSAAVVRRGDLALGVWTNGRCPMLARVLKGWLDRVLPADFGRIVDALSRQRDRLRHRRSGALVLEAAATKAVERLHAPRLYSSIN
jgi:precorrin-2 dehydrogenase/sirohydrochlorin ferrochelatase